MALSKIYPLSQDQKNFLKYSRARVNLLDGATRSGKNFVENLRMLHALKFEPYSNPQSDVAFFGATKEAVLRNFLKDLFGIVGKKNYSYNSTKGTGRILGRDFYVFNAKNKDTFGNIRGGNIGLALGTEITLLHEDFFYEMNARVAHIEDSMIFIDTNPDSPYHYIHTNFIENTNLTPEDFMRFRFTLDSNLSLTEKAKEKLKRVYVEGTLKYQRMVQGLWVLSDGIIYTKFNPTNNTFDYHIDRSQDHRLRWVVGIDYGNQHPTVFGLFANIDDRYYLVKEYYHDGSEEGQKSDEEYFEDLKDFIGDLNIDAIYCDPSATHFINTIRSRSRYPIYNPDKLEREEKKKNGDDEIALTVDKRVSDGIQTVQSAFYNEKFFIHKRCKHSLKELSVYIWDKKASAAKGRDVPLKLNDHCMDMIRYVLQSDLKRDNSINIWKKLAGYVA